MTIKIYGFPASSNVQKPLWVCGELGLKFKFIEKGGPCGLTTQLTGRRG